MYFFVSMFQAGEMRPKNERMHKLWITPQSSDDVLEARYAVAASFEGRAKQSALLLYRMV
jgi:hypothetical protein